MHAFLLTRKETPLCQLAEMLPNQGWMTCDYGRGKRTGALFSLPSHARNKPTLKTIIARLCSLSLGCSGFVIWICYLTTVSSSSGSRTLSLSLSLSRSLSLSLFLSLSLSCTHTHGGREGEVPETKMAWVTWSQGHNRWGTKEKKK